MATTIEKFVFEMTNPYADSDEGEGGASGGATPFNGGIVQDFQMNADSRVVYTKINNAGHPAFYAIIDDSQPIVTRRFAAFPSRVALPPNWVYIGSNCDGKATFHIGEVIVTN